tara:strand:- start:3246 stop:3611 length:366 start_codon:yes stop_codon:yes gene_type:complete
MDRLIFECSAIDAEKFREGLDQAIAAAPIDHSEVQISQRMVRGADAVTLVQIAVDLSVNVDIGDIILSLSTLLAVIKGRVILGGQSKKIESEKDVQKFIENFSASECDATGNGAKGERGMT